MGFNYSQIANFESRTYSNTFWNIFGASKHVTKYGPHAPYLLQKHFKQHKKDMETAHATHFCKYGHPKKSKISENPYISNIFSEN